MEADYRIVRMFNDLIFIDHDNLYYLRSVLLKVSL